MQKITMHYHAFPHSSIEQSCSCSSCNNSGVGTSGIGCSNVLLHLLRSQAPEIETPECSFPPKMLLSYNSVDKRSFHYTSYDLICPDSILRYIYHAKIKCPCLSLLIPLHLHNRSLEKHSDSHYHPAIMSTLCLKPPSDSPFTLPLSEPSPNGDYWIWNLSPKERDHIASMLACDGM
jgi:hypothetical protein